MKFEDGLSDLLSRFEAPSFQKSFSFSIPPLECATLFPLFMFNSFAISCILRLRSESTRVCTLSTFASIFPIFGCRLLVSSWTSYFPSLDQLQKHLISSWNVHHQPVVIELKIHSHFCKF